MVLTSAQLIWRRLCPAAPASQTGVSRSSGPSRTVLLFSFMKWILVKHHTLGPSDPYLYPRSFVLLEFGSKYLIVFYCVVAQTLPLSEALGDLLGVEIRIHARVESQIPVYLWEGLRTAHVSLPLGAALLRTVAALVVNGAWTKQNKT